MDQSEKLDKIIRVVTRTEVHVENLLKVDAEKRLTQLETRNKFMAIVGGIVLSLAVVKEHIVELLFG